MNRLYTIIIPSLFFIQYLGLGAIAQIIIIIFIAYELLTGSRFYLSDADKLLFLGILTFFLFKCFGVSFAVNTLLFRFYWGFTIFYLFFLLTKFQLNYVLLFWLTVVVSVIEAILINTVLPLELMRNIPAAHKEILSLEADLGFFKRSYGLASSPTSSATLLVVILACIYKIQNAYYKDFYILVTAIVLLLFGSGTGFLLFLIFLAFKFQLFSGFKLILGMAFVTGCVFFILAQDISNGGILMRMSGNYFETLIDLKLNQILEVFHKLNNSVFEILFGVNYESVAVSRVMSDFGWIDFLECYGILGVTLFLFFIYLKNNALFLPVLLVLLGYFHYPAIGSIPGQILFAGILSYQFKNNSETIRG